MWMEFKLHCRSCRPAYFLEAYKEFDGAKNIPIMQKEERVNYNLDWPKILAVVWIEIDLVYSLNRYSHGYMSGGRGMTFFLRITEWLETTSSTKVTKTCGMIAAGRGCGVFFYLMSRSLSGFVQFTVDVKFINLLSASKGVSLFDKSDECDILFSLLIQYMMLHLYLLVWNWLFNLEFQMVALITKVLFLVFPPISHHLWK